MCENISSYSVTIILEFKFLFSGGIKPKSGTITITSQPNLGKYLAKALKRLEAISFT